MSRNYETRRDASAYAHFERLFRPTVRGYGLPIRWIGGECEGLHNAIQNGDTITLPAGTFTWTTRVNFSKAITLQGIGATIIRDAVQNGQLISINLVAGRLTRLTGIEFQDGGRASYFTGVVTVGSNTNTARSFAWITVNGVWT